MHHPSCVQVQHASKKPEKQSQHDRLVMLASGKFVLDFAGTGHTVKVFLASSQFCTPQVASNSPSSCSGAGEDRADANQQPLSQLAAELPHIAAPLAAFLALHSAHAPVGASTGAPTSPPQSSPVSPQRQSLLTQEVQVDDDSSAALALPPVLLPRHRTYQLTEKGILEYTGVSLIGMLTQLNLHGSALKKLEVSGCCTSTDVAVCLFICISARHDQVLASSI